LLKLFASQTRTTCTSNYFRGHKYYTSQVYGENDRESENDILTFLEVTVITSKTIKEQSKETSVDELLENVEKMSNLLLRV